MSWAGEVTVYSTNGVPVKSFHVDDVLQVYTAPFPPVVEFVQGKFSVTNHGQWKPIMITNLPFILDGEGEPPMGVNFVNDNAQLLSADGKVVREFRFDVMDFISGIFRFYLPGNKLLLTTFSVIQIPVVEQG